MEDVSVFRLRSSATSGVSPKTAIDQQYGYFYILNNGGKPNMEFDYTWV